MNQKVKPKVDRTINLRRGEDVLVRCRRHRRDEERRNTRVINLRPGEDVLVRCRRRDHR